MSEYLKLIGNVKKIFISLNKIYNFKVSKLHGVEINFKQFKIS